jgi:hypothetical protein
MARTDDLTVLTGAGWSELHQQQLLRWTDRKSSNLCQPGSGQSLEEMGNQSTNERILNLLLIVKHLHRGWF